MKRRLLSFLKTITARARSPGTVDPSAYLPPWELRHGPRPATETRLCVLWTGSQISSLPILVHESTTVARPRRRR